MIVRLIYVSTYSVNFSDRRNDIDRIIATSQRNNRERNISGLLMATDTAFAQVLEGARFDVAETYGRIATDPRHANLRIVMENEVNLRCFGHSSMGLAERDEDTERVFADYGIRQGHDLVLKSAATLLDLAISLSFCRTRLGHPA